MKDHSKCEKGCQNNRLKNQTKNNSSVNISVFTIDQNSANTPELFGIHDLELGPMGYSTSNVHKGGESGDEPLSKINVTTSIDPQHMHRIGK